MVWKQIASAWDRMNPSERSPTYLLKLMAFMLACFAVGLLVGGIPEEHPDIRAEMRSNR